jgi:nucleotide-binding universal stress UspA family protein
MESFQKEPLDIYNLAAPQRILVATDLTDGELLIPHAVFQAKASNAIVTLVHAILPGETIPLDAGSYAYVDTARIEREILVLLREMAAQIEAEGVPCNVIAKHGFAPEVIREEIDETGATRLIMASHGRGKLRKLMLGSVAHDLLGGVTIPVFVVGPHCAGSAEHATPRRILHPVSMLDGHRKSIDFAIELARIYKAELTLLHVPDRESETGIHPGYTLTWAEKLASKAFPESVALEHPIEIIVAYGNRVEEIRNAAARTHADWIVLGVDEGSPAWLLAESTAYKVLAVADCPVVAIRRETRRQVEKSFEEAILAGSIG